MRFSGRGILLDIEGTTSSISFVYDVMFPFVRRQLDGFLATFWKQESVQLACEMIARDAGLASVNEWGREETGKRVSVRDQVFRLMDDDVKATGLKQLQGLIWKRGFESGELKAHVYDDVPPAVEAWTRSGRDVRIYSSGSIQAQQLFFAHTIYGDMLHLFSGHYDTTTGPKRESQSYRRIAEAFGFPSGEILFLSDVVGELDAAREAGLQTGLCARPGNNPAPSGHGHSVITDFAQVEVN